MRNNCLPPKWRLSTLNAAGILGTLRVQLTLIVVILISSSRVECMFEEPRQPSYLEAKVGSYVVFNCPVDFPQDIVIPYVLHWSKDGQKVFSWYDGEISASELFVGRLNFLDKHEGYGKASVNLTSIRESDQGWYECKITFPNRTPSSRNNGTWFYLTVLGGSLIKIPPVNQTIMEGKTAFFHCVMKSPESSQIRWFKDGKALSELVDLTHRSMQSPDGSLSIDPTMMSDLGEYECVVRNNDGETQSARAFLNIQYKAKVIYAPPEVYLPFGQPAILDCHFRANPPLRSLRWEKDGFLFDPYNVPGVFYKQNGSLFFSKVDESHSGRYTCTPYNELGTDGPSPLITVIVQQPPVFTIKPKPVYLHKLGDNVTMICDAADRDGNHRPTLVWSRRDGVALPLGRYSIDGGNITIENIVEEDRGIYQCAATNEAATIIADTELMIANVPPRPPYNLTANSSQNAITIRWQPGYIRPHLEYVVWYRMTNATEWRTMRPHMKNMMEATITNLQPGCEYEFMVLSQDQYGDGMFSKSFRYYTKPKQFRDPELFQHPLLPFGQIGPPRNLIVHRKSNGYIAAWDPPDYGADSLRVYILRWWLQPLHLLHGSVETRENYYVVGHLKENERYTFQVFALGTNNYEAGSNEYEFLVPSQRLVRAIITGSVVVIIFMITAVSVYIYVKKSCFQSDKENSVSEKVRST
ncbi:unnamed protein product [Hermetia illucens]|uniref:Protein turtle n=1 Tax=Hermetia illucens TaxID=343691 RepID=A0A7R8UGP7_HERIL|nr:protein borderless isoform X2 [Hermetia illucens]CAD7080232.1 unnamed protein product [Hermetia illucens]